MRIFIALLALRGTDKRRHDEAEPTFSMVLTYHEIVPDSSRYAYAVARADFRSHVEFLAAWRNRNAADAPVITLDDGHVTHFECGLPILEENRFRGIFFVTVGWIGNRPGYMTWAQAREIAACGHEVQSHGWSHSFLTNCTASELQTELTHSKDTLEQNLGIPVCAISMPGGRWNQRVVEACAAAGYRRIYTSDVWRQRRLRGAVVEIGRFMVSNRTGVPQLRRLLDDGSTLRRLQVEHTLKRLLRAVAGDRMYQHAWRVLRCKAAVAQYEADGLSASGDRTRA